VELFVLVEGVHFHLEVVVYLLVILVVVVVVVEEAVLEIRVTPVIAEARQAQQRIPVRL
jgi:hypothetical protein